MIALRPGSAVQAQHCWLPALACISALRLAVVTLAALLLAGTGGPRPAAAQDLANVEAAWVALRAGGAVVLLRHAQTVPGIGDPPGFRLEDCATQRNLSDEGREQARRIGKALQATGVAVGEVLSSRWCRCLDTATEAFGRVTPWPSADSFFDRRAAGSGDDPLARQTAELRSRVAAYRGKDTLVVVTHQVNITALTGIVPAMGELVVLKPDRRSAAGFGVAGRLPAP